MSTVGSPHESRRRGSLDANKKPHIACNRCRRRRTRCDGAAPLRCSFCESRDEVCEYAEAEKKIPVPESLYNALLAGQTGISPAAHMPGFEHEDVNGSLPMGMPNVVRGASGQHTYRGEGSSINWALLLQDLVNPRSKSFGREMQMEYPTYSDPKWLQRESYPTKGKLPPYDTAKRLYHAQYLYIGTIFCFCQPQDFERRLNWVYLENPPLVHREARLAYCQVLLIFAYGLLYSLNQWSGDDGPPGFGYFKKALEYLPDAHEEGSILFVEVLSLVGYYLQNLNRRDAAFLYTGLALRMAISLGMHQEVVSDPAMDNVEREHRRRVWWSIYSMDRILCVKSGNPITISDEDIDVAYPSPVTEMDLDPSPARVLSHYSKLSKILGDIGEKIYRKKRKTGSSLVSSVHTIMSDLSTWYGNLPQELRIDFKNLGTETSREAISTHLHYFQCINMTARPLLFHVIQRRLKMASEGTAPEVWSEGLSKSTAMVIEKSIAAARDNTKLMVAAAKQDLVATYGFMDGEHAFSAALVLVMVNVAFPRNRRDADAMRSALDVLRNMAERGNSHIRARHLLLLDLLSSNEVPGFTDTFADLSDPPTTAQENYFAPNRTVSEFDSAFSPTNEESALLEGASENISFDLSTGEDMGIWNDVSMDLDAWLETSRLY